MLATPADAEIILKLYELRRESLMRAGPRLGHRRVLAGNGRGILRRGHEPRRSPQRIPAPGDFLLGDGGRDGAARGRFRELFVDCNAEGFLLLAKFAPILDDIRQRMPTFMQKTSEMVKRFTAAAARYEAAQKNVEGMRAADAAGFECSAVRLFAEAVTGRLAGSGA